LFLLDLLSTSFKFGNEALSLEGCSGFDSGTFTMVSSLGSSIGCAD